MNRSRTTLIAVLVVTLTGAAAHGIVTCRWTGGRDESPAIPVVPETIGSWVGTDTHSDIDDPGIANLTRKYTHSRTGRSILISLTVGHPGLVGVHTPDYCYRGSGYEQVTGVESRHADLGKGGVADFRTTRFQKQSAAGAEHLRIFWAWSADGTWKASDWDPRLSFLGQPRLYKLYVVVGGQTDAAPGKDPQLDEFLSVLLDALNQSLFTAPAS